MRVRTGQIVHVIEAVCVPVIVSRWHIDSDLIEGMGFPASDEESFTAHFRLVKDARRDPAAEEAGTWHTLEECPWER